MNVLVKKLHGDAVVPRFAHAGDAGADLVSVEETVIPAGERKLVKTGIAIQLPPFMEAQIRPRSGLAIKHGITVLNTPGTIDYQYRGEVGVILYNTSKEDFKVEKGMRIAQMVLSDLPNSYFVEVDELTETERGAGGFGSTGV